MIFLDYLQENHNFNDFTKTKNGQLSSSQINDTTVYLLKPCNFMNLNGLNVKKTSLLFNTSKRTTSWY